LSLAQRQEYRKAYIRRLRDGWKASHYRHVSQIRRKSLIKSSDSLSQILNALLDGRSTAADWQKLGQLELANSRQASAFNLTTTNVEAQLQQRAELLRLTYAAFWGVCDRHLGNPEFFLPTLWQFWLPLAQRLVQQRQAKGHPFVQGVLGGQGTGKTTLGLILSTLLQTLGYNTLSWSLDDLYKTYADRLQLQQQIPELVWRGPPGTHDVGLGIQVFDQLRHPRPNTPIAIPRFDKSLHNGMGDRIAPEFVQNMDVVLFEGWFVGVQPIEPIAFVHPPAPIQTEVDRAFARACNDRLQDYLPLWQQLDSLWVLYSPDYQLSKQWRQQAEAKMKAVGKPGMTNAEIDAFVEYFWKALHPDLFMRPTLAQADLVIAINPDHSLGEMYCLP